MVSLTSKNVTVKYKGKKVVVTLKEISFGEYMDLLRKYYKIEVKGKKTEVSIDAHGYSEEVTLRAIEKVEPDIMPKTLEAIRSLPRTDGIKLRDIALELNPFEL